MTSVKYVTAVLKVWNNLVFKTVLNEYFFSWNAVKIKQYMYELNPLFFMIDESFFWKRTVKDLHIDAVYCHFLVCILISWKFIRLVF